MTFIIMLLSTALLWSLKISGAPLTWEWVLAPIWIPLIGGFVVYSLWVLAQVFAAFVVRR